jgi:prophage regulatory protein
MSSTHEASGVVLRARDITTRLRISRPTLWRWVRAGTFPAPIRLGANSIAWRAEDILDWLASRPTVREARV